jgi:S-DNA-T family DNA segregation ATPase FtsK/SpoIIIE
MWCLKESNKASQIAFLEMNQRACEYFERAYGSIETRTKKRVQFKETLVCNYSKAVLPKIKDKPKFKGASKTGRATRLNFLVSIFQKQRGGTERKVVTLSLTWHFPIGSVLRPRDSGF